jgi:NTE family protein
MGLLDIFRRKDRPRIGLALGSGAARGGAHVGVLRAMAEMGLQVDIVAGTSVGALAGAAYATDSLAELEEFLCGLEWRQILSFVGRRLPRTGLIDGHKVAEFIRAHVIERRIEELPLSFAAVATDLVTGEEVLLRQGDLIEALRASVSIPGIFTPVLLDGRLLVDGGLVDPVPVSVARALGADLVIAVDVGRDVMAQQGLGAKIAGRKRLDTETTQEDRSHGSGLPPVVPAVARHEELEETDPEELAAGETALLAAQNSTGRKAEDVAQDEGKGSRLASGLRQKLSQFEAPGFGYLRSWLQREPTPNVFDILVTSLYVMQGHIKASNYGSHPPDLLIQPPVGHISWLDFGRSREAVELGYVTGRRVLEPLLKEGFPRDGLRST